MSDDYYVGSGVVMQATFRDAAGDLTDPTAFGITVEEPDGVLVEYTYPTPGTIARISAGIFQQKHVATKAGLYEAGVECEDADLEGYIEGSFFVKARRVGA